VLAPRPPYVELRCHSAFSFLDGASLPEDLVAAAVALGYDAIALTDRDGLYSAPRFFRAAGKLGAGTLRPLVGSEVKLAAGSAEGGSGEAAPPVLLLVEDRRGYRNLCRLLTGMKEGRPKGEGAASYDLVAAHAAGLVALAGPAPRPDLERLRDIFGPRGLYVELQRHLDDQEAHVGRRALHQAEALGLPVVATNDVRYAKPHLRRVQDVLTCARLKTTVDEAGRRLLRNAERHLKPPAAMAALFADRPDAVRATRAIAERCAFTLADLGYSFPTYPTPPGESEQSLLEALTWRGARERYRPLGEKARRQIAHELKVIGKLGLAGYFLVVWDIVEHARQRGILVQGRGSAANSATCYALGITAIDPVGMDLLFERFLSEERVRSATDAADRMPDIDLDLPSGDRREEVIQYVYRRYGERGAGMTANVITYRPRMAVRDAGRALGFSEEQLGRISKHLPSWIVQGEKPLSAFLAEAGFPPTERRTRLLGEVATQMLNLPRHLGQHSGGLVICAGRLDEVVPLEPATMPGRVVVQWDKDDCADLGIVKVDLLGLGMLAVLEDAVPLLRAHEGVEIDYAHLPPDDPKVYAMLRAADTVGVFQVESRAQMATLPRMRPERFYDLVVEVAIIRPGPIVGNMVNPYLQRRQGRAPVTYPHPSLEPILARTLGVPLFQEQLIRLAMVAAGFSGGQAEELRRAMGFKRSAERMQEIERDLRAGMTARGITGAAQEEIVQGIKSFALYGFPESHAASFALIAYASAYLKAHHGAAFLCALLNNWPMGFYHPATLVSDAARHGMPTLPIDVTASAWTCTLERHPAGRDPALPPCPGPHHRACGCPLAVRLGLKFTAGLREQVGQTIAAEAGVRPFASLADFHARIRPQQKEMRALAQIGALGRLGGTRRQALWQVEALGRSGALFASSSPESSARPSSPSSSPLPEMAAHEETIAELRGTGVTTGPHPVSFVRPRLERESITPAAALAALPDGARARIGGMVVVRQRPGTARGIVFITVEDETGFSNAVVYPDRFESWRSVIVGHPALIIEGVVQNRDGVTTLLAERFAPLSSPALTVSVSHDFH
jgi:error-prone DNA polymerase